MSIDNVSKLSFQCGINDAIDTLNEAIDAYNEIIDPINEPKEASLSAAGMTDYPTATALVLMRGVMTCAAAQKEPKWEDVKDTISVTIQEPYLDLGQVKLDKVANFGELVINLPLWIKGYFTGALAILDVIEKLVAIAPAV